MKDEFLAIINHNELARFFGMTYGQLAKILYKYDAHFKYKEFSIPKKSGGKRSITAPRRKIKNIQNRLKDVLYKIYPGRVPAHGFALDKSIVTRPLAKVIDRGWR